MSERELCRECGFPNGFCKHTIQEEYKELCSNTPLKKEDIWQLVRSHAILRTKHKNICYYNDKEIHELEHNNGVLREENAELRHFKKHIQDILKNDGGKK